MAAIGFPAHTSSSATSSPAATQFVTLTSECFQRCVDILQGTNSSAPRPFTGLDETPSAIWHDGRGGSKICIQSIASWNRGDCIERDNIEDDSNISLRTFDQFCKAFPGQRIDVRPLLDRPAIESFKTQAQSLAPTRATARAIQIGNKSYRVWWDASNNTLFMQPYTNYAMKNSLHRIGIVIEQDGSISYSRGTESVVMLPPEDLILIGHYATSLNNLYLEILQTNAQTFARDKEHAAIINYTADGTAHAIWWDATDHAIHIQARDDYRANNDLNRICLSFRDPALSPTILPQHAQLAACCADQLAIQASLDLEKESFSPACLKLLFSFFRSAGSAHMAEGPIAHSAPLTISTPEQTVCVWGRRLTNSTNGRVENTLRFQNVLYYWNERNDKKLSLTIDEISGEVTGIEVEGRGVDLSYLKENIYQPGSVWNRYLLSTLRGLIGREPFVDIRPQYQSIRCTIHPLVLKHAPETVLAKLCPSTTANCILPANSVSFLKDDCTPDAGIDAGGPTRQFLSLLCSSLFRRGVDQMLPIDEELFPFLPSLPNLSSEQITQAALRRAHELYSLADAPQQAGDIARTITCEIIEKNQSTNAHLRNIGKLLAAMYGSPNSVTGRVLHNDFFILLQAALRSSTLTMLDEPTDLHMLETLQEVSYTQDRDLSRYCLATPMGLPPLNSDQQEFLLTCEVFDGDEERLSRASVEEVQAEIKTYLLDKWGNRCRAAWKIAKGVPEASRQIISVTPPSQSSLQIQGNPLNRELIKSHIICPSQNAVVLEEVQWLKEFIDEQDDKWVEQLVFTILGQSIFEPTDRINVIARAGAQPITTHTCSRSIELPTAEENYVNSADREDLRTLPSDDLMTRNRKRKARFFLNLDLTMNSGVNFTTA